MKTLSLLLILISLLRSEISTPSPQIHPTEAFSCSVDPFQDPLILTIHTRHQKAVDGDKNEVKLLAVDLEKLTKEQPHNSLLLAYLGSVYTLQSRDAFPGPGKLELLKKGGKTLDQAVDQDPTNLATRFIRAVNYYELPRIFNKRSTSREDFQLIVTQMETPRCPQHFSDETRQAIYYYAGLSYKQLKQPEQAIKAWECGLKIYPYSLLGKKIEKELKR